MKAQVNHKPPRSTTFRPKALTPAQANAIELFLVGKGDTEVAQILGIARETAWSWRKENPCFMAALQRRRAEVWGTAGERLRSLMAKAVDNIAGLVQTWPRPPLHRWGIPPTRLQLSSGRHLRRAILPKFSTYKARIWAMILNNFRISSPNGR